MNILQVLPELNVGGVETGTLDLAKHLVKLGHNAVVVSCGGALVKELESYGIKHYQLAVNKKSIPTMIKMVPKLAEIITRENIDIVHARSRVPAWIAYFAARRTRRVFITTCHGYYTRHPFSFVMGWAKKVIVLSNVIGRHMIEDFGVPVERVRMIPRSVDIEKFKFIDPQEKKFDYFNVGIIGRITPLKGHLDFIKAMAKVARVIPRLKIWIVGDAPESKEAYKEQVQVLVRRLGLSHCTQFLGTQRNIPEILSNFNLLVLATTTQEAFGRVIIEAQASGVPVVATKVGGVIDIIENGKNGILVAPADPLAMSEAIIKIAKDPALAGKMAHAAYKKVVEKYNIELMVKNTMKVYDEALQDKSILIIKLSSLGDIILSTAAIRAIREKFSRNYKITLLVDEKFKEPVLTCPYIDELLVCDFKFRDSGIKGLLKLAKILRKKNFDIAIDLQNNHRSHLLSFLSLAVDRYGYKNNKFGFLLNKGVRLDKAPAPPVEHQFRILKPLGIELNDPRLEMWPAKKDHDYVDEFLGSEWLNSKQRLIGINISASKRWLTKGWPIEHMVKLCEELARKEFRMVITGLEHDSKLATELIKRLKNTKAINACGKTSINQLACLIARCSVFISGDSAPLHIASSQNIPVVALFGPTDPLRHIPPHDKIIVIRKELSCSPCYKPNCRNIRCMNQIKPEEVIDAVMQLLEGK
ncbi:MAG: lipopolysaccharide heptosyltransferase II [Candidatus Omnitrophota bacterium]|jgi:lipopolysaccharide heptosyltransferase II|nr:MAG: lipopolysaccharide heptosyltransferase II [Candidatus Omnitrophota bacterium]